MIRGRASRALARHGPVGPIRSRVARLGIRSRLVLNVAAAMAVVLIATSGFVFWRVQLALDRQLDTDLRDYHSVVVAAVRSGEELPRDTAGQWYQVLDPRGRVLLASTGLSARSMVPREQLARALAGGRVYGDHGSFLPPDPEALRTLATALMLPAGHVVVATAISRQPRDEALHELLLQLAVADVLVLLAAAYVGYRTARGALDPVERYRLAAAEAGASPGTRMPVPDDRDDELTRLGRTFNDLLARIEESVDREHRFIADASHELRTPLALLKAEVELALHKPRTAQYSRQTLLSISVEVERLVHLANMLLDLEELMSAAAVPMEAVHPAEILDAASDRHRASLLALDRDIVVMCPDDLVATLNRRWVEAAVDNLIANATRYGGGTVTVAALPEPGFVAVSVSDEGAGFPVDFLDHAFERFARAESSRSAQGSGLGLALVRAVCVAHSGEARIEQSPGRTTVTMSLRSVARDTAEPPASASGAVAPSGAPSRRRSSRA